MRDEADVLRKARENFVRKRRAMAEQMVPSGAAPTHFAPAFVELQTAIEAIDRAIADEDAQTESDRPPSTTSIELATVDGAVVDRDTDAT